MAGLARVASTAYPDATQFDPASPYFDPKAAPGAPRWLHVDVQLVAKTRLLALRQMRQAPALAGMLLLKPGNRLSITPVTPAEWAGLAKERGVPPPDALALFSTPAGSLSGEAASVATPSASEAALILAEIGSNRDPFARLVEMNNSAGDADLFTSAQK